MICTNIFQSINWINKMGKGQKPNKPKLSPEEIAKRKAEAEAKKKLKDVNQVLVDIRQIQKNGIPYFCKDYDGKYTEKGGNNVTVGSLKGNENVKLIRQQDGIETMYTCVIYKYMTDDEEPIHKLTVLVTVPNDSKISINVLASELASRMQKENASNHSVIFNENCCTIDFNVESFIKDADKLRDIYRNLMIELGIYEEEDDDDDDMGAMMEDAGIEW